MTMALRRFTFVLDRVLALGLHVVAADLDPSVRLGKAGFASNWNGRNITSSV
jgi:hypothetical protein